MESSSNIPNLEQGYRVAYLIAQYLKGALTEAEGLELETWQAQSEANRQLFNNLTDPAYLAQEAQQYHRDDTETYLGRLKEVVKDRERKRVRKLWLAGAAAAVITGAAVVFLVKPFLSTDPSKQIDQPGIVTSTAIPEWKSWKHARLVIGLKNEIALGDIAKDTILAEGISVKNGALLVYAGAKEVVQHNLFTAPQTSYSVQLPDGTLVTLNANSQLVYPTRFEGLRRRVQLSGEAYFQVAKDPVHPFVVETKMSGAHDHSIEAVGTAFLVNSVRSEPTPRTTLLEGKVIVSAKGLAPVFMTPGQEAIETNGRLIVQPADTVEALAWTKHQFKFDDTPLIDALRQLAHWHGLELSGAAIPSTHVHGTFSRDQSLDSILRLLASTGDFRYRVNEQRITILK